MYVAGLVAYDGTDFHGFQIQQNASTVQSVLEVALLACTGMHARVIGSGRTDSGVHASGQVISAKVEWDHKAENLQNAWNAHLPSSVAVRQLVEAQDEFHPRFSAEKRTYRYTIYDSGNYSQPSTLRMPKVSPLTDRFALYVAQPLNITAMQTAATFLVGEHDFATFGQPPQGDNTVRTVYEATWQVVETTLPTLHDYPGRRLTFTVTANAFLRQMVRNLVGTLLVIGRGQWQPNKMEVLIAARDRSRCAAPAPPQGLVLEHVTYPTAVDPWGNKAV